MKNLKRKIKIARAKTINWCENHKEEIVEAGVAAVLVTTLSAVWYANGLCDGRRLSEAERELCLEVGRLAGRAEAFGELVKEGLQK